MRLRFGLIFLTISRNIYPHPEMQLKSSFEGVGNLRNSMMKLTIFEAHPDLWYSYKNWRTLLENGLLRDLIWWRLENDTCWEKCMWQFTKDVRQNHGFMLKLQKKSQCDSTPFPLFRLTWYVNDPLGVSFYKNKLKLNWIMKLCPVFSKE